MPVCSSCKRQSDWLERVNPTGETGRFYCSQCLDEHRAAIQDLKRMSDDELNLVDYTVVRWVCSGKGCRGHTKVRDYGIAPEYWHPRKSIHWFDITGTFWMCSKHYKLFKRLKKNFDLEAVYKKLFDPNKIKIQPLK